MGQFNIRVNCISPGAIATPIFWGGSERANTLSEEENAKKMQKLQNNLAKATPIPSSGIANDIAYGAYIWQVMMGAMLIVMILSLMVVVLPCFMRSLNFLPYCKQL